MTHNDSLINPTFRCLAVKCNITHVTYCTPLEECWIIYRFTTATN